MTDTVTTDAHILSADFKGQIIRADEAGYDAARAVYNGGIDRRPKLIVRPTGAADIIDAVNYAREAQLPLAVRCGGHSVAGTSICEGGVLVDLSSMKGVVVDPARGTAIAQAGVLWGEYDRETHSTASPPRVAGSPRPAWAASRSEAVTAGCRRCSASPATT